MRVFGRVDNARIESDEDGFHLIVETDEGDHFNFRIHPVAEGFYWNVRNSIGRWLSEAEVARRTHVPPMDPTVYDPSDPKHPNFHSVHADLYDQREKGTA